MIDDIKKGEEEIGDESGSALPSYLPHKQPYHFLINLPILLIPHRQINPGLFIYNTLIMGECPETIDSVVGTHAAFSEAAEAHIAGGKMNENIVDTAATETAPRSYFPGGFFIVSEDVEGQRVCHGIDLCNSTSERIVGKNRKNRAEDFLLHDRIIECHMIQDRRLDLKRFTVCFAAAYELGGIDQSGNSGEMLFVDDLSVIFVIQR